MCQLPMSIAKFVKPKTSDRPRLTPTPEIVPIQSETTGVTVLDVKRGARARQGAEMWEISEQARVMAAAAIGLRGEAARKAMQEAKIGPVRRRWAAVCEATAGKQERIVAKAVAEIEERVRALLGPVVE